MENFGTNKVKFLTSISLHLFTSHDFECYGHYSLFCLSVVSDVHLRTVSVLSAVTVQREGRGEWKEIHN